jgi:hypothetical protein
VYFTEVHEGGGPPQHFKTAFQTAARMTNMRSAPGRDQRIPGPVRLTLNCLMPLSTVPEPMGYREVKKPRTRENIFDRRVNHDWEI